ncbi:MAG: hypothetical protein ABI867_34270 [Kofleriaceae bacterium]
MLITGMAYNRRATLDVAGDTLTWRAVQGWTGVGENIVTTIHEVRSVRFIELRQPWAGVAVGGLGVLLGTSEGWIVGGVAIAMGVALVGWRVTHPRRFLLLELRQTRLLLRVAAESAGAARALADRIDQVILSGEGPATPPMLP